MNPMLKGALGAVAAIVAAGVVVFAVEMLNTTLFPLPAGVGMDDPEALGQAMADAGAKVLVGVAVAWFLGAFAGGWVATRIGPSEARWPAGVFLAVFLLGTLANLFSFPHPAWFWVVGLAAIPAGWVPGVRVARG